MAKIGRTLSYIKTSPKPERNNGQAEQNQANGSSRPGNGGSSSIPGNLQGYLLKSIWDRVWEIKTDSQGNEYIFGKLPVVTQYGITMYADGGELNLPSIYAGLPIDGRTLIRDDNGVLMINPDIDLGGGASTWDELIGKPAWIGSTKPSYNYSEISQTPDLSVYATTKYLTDELKKYVTLNTEQTIAAQKNFLNGLSVGGLGITKSQDDVIYLDANLVVRGGITMYATDAIDVPSIIDALPSATYDTKGIAAFNPNDFSVVDGYVSFIGSGGVDDSVLADYAKKTDLSSYLPLTGGKVTGQIEYNFDKGSSECSVPAAGVLATNLIFNDGAFNKYKSFLGNVQYLPNGSWYNVISVRADNSSELFGMYLVTSMTDDSDNLKWNRQAGYNGTWQGERVILDSVNWRSYVTLGVNPTYDGMLTVNGSDSRGSYPALRMHIPNVNWQQFLMRGDGIVELRYGDGGQSGTWGQLALGTIFLDDQRDDVLYFPGKEYFDNHGNIHIPNADGSWSWNIYNSNGSNVMVVYTNGNIVSSGGITMYSDIRKKTKLQDVELSLKQIADAPLIEHYYNSDEKRTTHVGTIAQYWASMNDWFCKLDNEGYYTMEIQNAALASAISIARELVKYESKTDKEIRLLKDEVKRLKKEIKILKSA